MELKSIFEKQNLKRKWFVQDLICDFIKEMGLWDYFRPTY